MGNRRKKSKRKTNKEEKWRKNNLKKSKCKSQGRTKGFIQIISYHLNFTPSNEIEESRKTALLCLTGVSSLMEELT